MLKKYPTDIVRLIRARFNGLPEKSRRHYAAEEAMKLGHGGVSYIGELLGIDRNTIMAGRKELLSLSEDECVCYARQRKAGGGRKKTLYHRTVAGVRPLAHCRQPHRPVGPLGKPEAVQAGGTVRGGTQAEGQQPIGQKGFEGARPPVQETDETIGHGHLCGQGQTVLDHQGLPRAVVAKRAGIEHRLQEKRAHRQSVQGRQMLLQQGTEGVRP